jgi:putative ABC transport system substrate-binding protein
MKRRQALFAAGVLFASPLLRAQAERVRRVGVLVLSASNTLLVPRFRKRLSELEWVEGKNLLLEVRHADNRLERLPGLVAELVRLNVEVIVTAATPVTRAAKAGTATIPVVFTWVGDPVGTGLVTSLARPGGNLTGLSNVSFEIGPKQIELLKALIPNLRRVAELSDPAFFGASRDVALSQLKDAAARAGITLIPVSAKTSGELEDAFATASRERATAMVVPPEFPRHRRLAASWTRAGWSATVRI